MSIENNKQILVSKSGSLLELMEPSACLAWLRAIAEGDSHEPIDDLPDVIIRLSGEKPALVGLTINNYPLEKLDKRYITVDFREHKKGVPGIVKFTKGLNAIQSLDYKVDQEIRIIPGKKSGDFNHSQTYLD